MTDGDKERARLLATFFNNLGIATVTIGFLTPVIAITYRATSAPPLPDLLGMGWLWFLSGVMLHVAARRCLEDADDG